MRCMVLWVCYMAFSFSWMFYESWLDSSVQGWRRSLRKYSFFYNSWIYINISFPSCKRTKHWTDTNVHNVVLISSYCCCASLISMFNCCSIGSSYSVSHKPISWVNSWSQPWIVKSSWPMDSFIVVPLCSWTSSGVVGWSVSLSLDIYIWNSKVRLPTSSLASRSAAATFLNFVSSYASYGICNYGTVWQACSIINSSFVLHTCISYFSLSVWVFSSYICALLTLHSLRTIRARFSLICNSYETPWGNAWRA